MAAAGRRWPYGWIYARRGEAVVAAAMPYLTSATTMSECSSGPVPWQRLSHGCSIVPRKRRMNDSFHDLRRLQRLVREFGEAREWGRFHDPKNLAMAMAVEVGELMDHYRWIANEESHSVMADSSSGAQVKDELADVLILLLEFANVTGVDLAAAVEAKLARNAERYPVELARGNATKHDRLRGGGPKRPSPG